MPSIPLGRLAQQYRRMLAGDLGLAFGIASIAIVVGVLIGIIGSTVFVLNHAPHARYLLDPHDHLSFLANWDGVDYLNIAKHGYTTKFLTGWFPVYPLLIRLLAAIIRSYLAAAIAISWVALVGMVYYYIKIVKSYFKSTSNYDALKAVSLFIFFPTGMYMIAAYTESLFAFLSLAALYYAMQKRYLVAALFLMITTATHVNGVYVVLLVALVLFEQKVRLRNIIMTVLIGSLGLVSYMAYLFRAYHNPLAFLSAQRDHGWLHTSVLGNVRSIGVLNAVLLVGLLVAIVYWWKRRKSFALYAGSYLLIPLIGGQFSGFPRYVLMAFPLQIALYAVVRRRKMLYLFVIAVSFVIWTYVLIRFSAGYVVS
jgi:hypothetical protein